MKFSGYGHEKNLARLLHAWLDCFAFLKLGAAEVCAVGVPLVIIYELRCIDMHMRVVAFQITGRSTVFSTACLLTIKKTSNQCITDTFYEGNQFISGFSSQRVNNAESVSRSWRHDLESASCGTVESDGRLFHVIYMQYTISHEICAWFCCALFCYGYHTSSQMIHGTWWRHQMETFSRYWPFVRGIHRSPVHSPHKGQWRGALIFSLICAWKTPEQTLELPVIWDAMALIVTSL